MRTILGILIVILPCAASGQALADGFYLRSAEDSAPFALTQDGEKVPLGPAQAVAIRRSGIHSQDNANTTFWISLGIPYEVHAKAKSYVLVVANRAYPWAGSGGGNGDYEINFRVSGVDNVRDVSRFLQTPIEYRRHPGHQLLVSFTPALTSFRIGDAVNVKFRIENIGTNAVSFMKGGHYRGSSRDNQYTFSAQFLGKQVPDIGSNVHFGGLATRRVLEAGDVFEDEISLSKWFVFDKKGLYEILGSYELTFNDPNSETYRPIWTDYVTGKFLVKID
jgi:hypothetical protein